ncbi:helix-turn-helix transcriptional regulator [Paenibacillus solisilvae]|uniref:Helix-turn-helix transcriptional regulator n=1 Tax=Paenibacillus solisilvae TaxID=2486751 RepID=A0ABW0VXG3_9BACL
MPQIPINDRSLTQETFSFPLIVHEVTRKTSVAPHFHRFFEISFYIGGCAWEIVDGSMILASRGMVVCKLPHRIHSTKTRAGNVYTKFNLMFDIDILLESERDSELKHFYSVKPGDDHPLFLLDENKTLQLEQSFREMVAEFNSESPFKKTFIRAKLMEILIIVARSRMEETKGDFVAPLNTPPIVKSNRRMTDILHYMNNHFVTDLTLGGLSRKFNISIPHISKMIKKTTGMNFSSYLNEMRIELACSLLVSTEISILEVSEESGYRSFKTFSRRFLQNKGMSPTKYRKYRAALANNDTNANYLDKSHKYI